VINSSTLFILEESGTSESNDSYTVPGSTFFTLPLPEKFDSSPVYSSHQQPTIVTLNLSSLARRGACHRLIKRIDVAECPLFSWIVLSYFMLSSSSRNTMKLSSFYIRIRCIYKSQEDPIDIVGASNVIMFRMAQKLSSDARFDVDD
jgi:hypothetical protein